MFTVSSIQESEISLLLVVKSRVLHRFQKQAYDYQVGGRAGWGVWDWPMHTVVSGVDGPQGLIIQHRELGILG